MYVLIIIINNIVLFFVVWSAAYSKGTVELRMGRVAFIGGLPSMIEHITLLPPNGPREVSSDGLNRTTRTWRNVCQWGNAWYASQEKEMLSMWFVGFVSFLIHELWVFWGSVPRDFCSGVLFWHAWCWWYLEMTKIPKSRSWPQPLKTHPRRQPFWKY